MLNAQSKIQQPQSNYRAVIPSVSYSKVVSGQIREISHVNFPNSNFSTIFTNVIQIANDEGVDEELLAGFSEQHSENFLLLTIRPVKFFRPMSR
ncbi:hypothetical protein TNCV_3265341 [Trichonephila clavipes]|nr:hypothetical protein TNCV_3265341 [Trichonephila clavipes]